MSKVNLLLAGALLTVATGVASAQPAIQVIAAGSSAVWQTAAYGAWNNLAGGTAGAQHYTIKGNCTSGYCGYLNDTQRNASIPNESGNLAVIWDNAHTKVWAILSVDSVIGNRTFLAQPRALMGVDAETETTPGANLISTTLWGSDAAALPADVYAAINAQPLTAAFTDIRPEDAKYAQTRAVTPYDPVDANGLGYGTGPNTLIGTQIASEFSTSTLTTPVDFSLGGGTDPFSGKPTPAVNTISIGAAAIIFIINRTDAAGLGAPGAFTNINFSNAQNLFNGDICDSTQIGGTNLPPSVPVSVILREPLSGTMNTTEFSVFRTHRISPNPDNSQEKGVNPTAANSNPLNLTCLSGGGKRQRAIGTGQVVSNGVLPQADSIGYIFFSYGNVSPIAGTPNYGYLQLDGVDPINKTYINGELPVCTNGKCPATGTTFPNLRNGKYKAWSILRGISDAAGTPNLQTLITAIQHNINTTVPDFVPAVPVGIDPGLKLYRSHFMRSGVAPNNGLGGETESGGDVGGCIEAVSAPPGVLNCHQ